VIAQGALISLVTRVVAVALGLAITLIVARIGAHEQGIFALFTAVEGGVLALCSGLGIALARRISHHGESPAEIVSTIVLTSIVAGSLVGVLLYVVAGSIDSYSSLWILAAASPLLLIASNLSGVYLGQGRMRALAGVTLGGPLLTLLFVALFFLSNGAVDVESVLWSWVAARVVLGLITYRVLSGSVGLSPPSLHLLRSLLPFVLAIGLTNLIGIMNYKVDLFLVEHFLGLSSTGVYSIAVMIAELLWFVSSALAQAAYARIGAPDRAEAARLTLRVAHTSILLLLLLAIPLWLGAALLLPLLLGKEYAAALPVLALLLPGVVAYGAASGVSAFFTNHVGRPLIPAAIAAFSLLVNLIASLILIPRWGMLGGAMATTLSYLLSVLLAAAIFSRVAAMPLSELLWPEWGAIWRQLWGYRQLILGKGARG